MKTMLKEERNSRTTRGNGNRLTVQSTVNCICFDMPVTSVSLTQEIHLSSCWCIYGMCVNVIETTFPGLHVFYHIFFLFFGYEASIFFFSETSWPISIIIILIAVSHFIYLYLTIRFCFENTIAYPPRPIDVANQNNRRIEKIDCFHLLNLA